MGTCVSKSSARSTTSERSEKCRWDKHGNVFFPVRRGSSQTNEGQDAGRRSAFADKNTYATMMNPVYGDSDSPTPVKKGHFGAFSKLLRGSKGVPLQHNKHPLSPSRSTRGAYMDLLVVKGYRSGQQGIDEKNEGENATDQNKRPLIKFLETDKNVTPSLSRSSSAKEGTLTRSSSAKEAALSRCSSEKEGKKDFSTMGERVTAKLRPNPSPDHLAASLKKAPAKLSDGVIPENLAGKIPAIQAHGECSSAGSVLQSSSNLVTNGLGLPCYHFRAGSPDKCRTRSASAHSSISSEDFENICVGGRALRRRSPNRRSPGKKSPRKCSPNRMRNGTGSIPLNPARLQKSLPENVLKSSMRLASRPPQPPKNITDKINRENRPVLREVQMNGMKPSQQAVKRDSMEVARKTTSTQNGSKSGIFSVHKDEFHLDMESNGTENASVLQEPRSGSKRLRSPKKVIAEHKITKEYVNFNISVPNLSEAPIKDKHVDTECNTKQEDKVLNQEDDVEGSQPDPDLLELLERTPKKLKKMALKLALMIELEHSKEEEEEEENDEEDSNKEKQGVDLELKLGMPSEHRRPSKDRQRSGDGIRVDFSVALDSPARSGSSSVPMTPRHSVSSTCNGLSVEARIGSSKAKYSDFSFHILKNPDKLFGPRVHVTRTEPKEESTPTRNVDVTAEHQARKEPEATSQVERCSSFVFENDLPQAVQDEADGEVTPTRGRGKTRDLLDLNKEASVEEEEDALSPAFEFKVRQGLSSKSSPATPIMPTRPKPTDTDALSLSADEIAEIWGAFEAGHEEVSA